MKTFTIQTLALQGIYGQSEKIETVYRGTLKRISEGFLIRYSENIYSDAPQVFTEITVTKGKKVIITKDGGIKSRLIVEEGKDNPCIYTTPIGSMELIISGELINYILTDSGGEVFLSYLIKQNETVISKNEVTITIKEV